LVPSLSAWRILDTDGVEFDSLGEDLAMAGDVNGDGYQDLVLGADGDDEWASNSGAAHVILGGPDGPAAASDQKLTSPHPGHQHRFGREIAAAGDVDGDGYADVLIGEDRAFDSRGAAHVFYGSSTGIDLGRVTTLTSPSPDVWTYYGSDVAGVGDVNGDGYDDVVVCHPHGGGIDGRAYLYYGSATGIDPSDSFVIDRPENSEDDNFAGSVTGAGDVNGDGFDDVLVSADMARGTGEAYLYFGSAAGLDVRREQLVKASERLHYAYFGWSMSSAGDVNADGFDDVVIGAPGDTGLGTKTGAAYVYLGSPTGLRLSSEVKLMAGHTATLDSFGSSVAGGGDLNGDGFDDLLVGLPDENGHGIYTGAAFVYFGGPAGIDPASETRLDDPLADDHANYGMAVSIGGDVDGDGFDDLLIGEPGWNDFRGAALLYQGDPCLGQDADGDGVLDCLDLCVGVDDFGDSDGDGRCDVALSVTSLVPATEMVLALDGAPEHVDVTFFMSDSLGASCHPTADVCHELHDPAVLGTVTSDDAGSAEITLPLSHSSGIGHVQAVWVDGPEGEASNVVMFVCMGDEDGDGLDDCIDTCVGFDVSGDVDSDGYCEPLLNVRDLEVGQEAVLTVIGAPSDLPVHFYASQAKGLGCGPKTDLCLDLDLPELLGVATADSSGRAELVYTPTQAGDLFLQAGWAVGAAAESSNVVTRYVTPL